MDTAGTDIQTPFDLRSPRADLNIEREASPAHA
jgi:hypothetical protein